MASTDVARSSREVAESDHREGNEVSADAPSDENTLRDSSDTSEATPDTGNGQDDSPSDGARGRKGRRSKKNNTDSKRKSKLLDLKFVALVLTPFLILAGAYGVYSVLTQQPPRAMQVQFELPSILVQTGTASRQPTTYYVESRGTVSPRTQTTMVSEVAGQIVEVSDAFVRGGFFKKGDLLMRIDPRNYETALKTAEAEVARVKTKLEQEQALAGYALQDWQRLKRSVQETPAPSALALRRPQMNEVLAELASADARLEKAQEDLSRTSILAPYDGLVTEKRADIGQFINAGSAIASTIAVDFAEVRLPLSLQDLKFVDLPNESPESYLDVELASSIGGESKTWNAQIVRSEGLIDSTSRVIYVVAQVEDPYDQRGDGSNALRIGSYVTAKIKGKDAGMIFAVPRHAVHDDSTMWLVDGESKIFPRAVTVVRTDDQNAYIVDGLQDGEIYCITAIEQPLPGMKVRFDGGNTT